MREGNYDTALIHIDKADELARKIDDKFWRDKSLVNNNQARRVIQRLKRIVT